MNKFEDIRGVAFDLDGTLRSTVLPVLLLR